MKKKTIVDDSGLYGIKHTNRGADKHWGKNCFNSSFPTSMACYMLDHDISAVYNRLEVLDGELRVVSSEISLREVFCSRSFLLDELDFHFESRFEPYQKYSFDTIDGIDLVVKTVDGGFLSPLEVKLTVLPTSGTAKYPEEKWGCEMVVRSATTSYCALGMFDAVHEKAGEVRDIFENACSDIGSWTNDYEMTHKTLTLAGCVNTFERYFLALQKPLVMQTVWKTQGQSPLLAENAFDIIVWSDYAFSRLFLDSNTPDKSKKTGKDTMSRPMRASAKLARCLWELSKSGRIRLGDIYRQMAFDTQTDKEFAIGGQIWRKYVTSDRVISPRLNKNVVSHIIKPGYIEKLMPERRFDQTLYFTVRNGDRKD
ncbi:MAG: HindVP family restriction endonuclease [Oscillospiraceae bacterium]|nr:HindVP family restriction endonuclease [Oscillospiraceae bacterium]